MRLGYPAGTVRDFGGRPPTCLVGDRFGRFRPDCQGSCISSLSALHQKIAARWLLQGGVDSWGIRSREPAITNGRTSGFSHLGGRSFG